MKKDRGAARRAKAASRPSQPRSAIASQDAANAWRQGISPVTAEAVDEMAAHAQAIVTDQLERFGAFPPFAITSRRDGEVELDSLEPEVLEDTAPQEAIEKLRTLVRGKADELLGALVGFPATLPDRSGVSALIIELEHRDGVSLRMVQAWTVAGQRGAKRTGLEDASVEDRAPDLLRSR